MTEIKPVKATLSAKAKKPAKATKPSSSLEEIEDYARIGMRKDEIMRIILTKKFSAAQNEAFERGAAQGRAAILRALYNAATSGESKDSIVAIKAYLAEAAKQPKECSGDIDTSAGAGVGGVSFQHLTKSKRDRMMAASAQAHLAKLYGAPAKGGAK